MEGTLSLRDVHRKEGACGSSFQLPTSGGCPKTNASSAGEKTWQIRFPIFQPETPGQRGPEWYLCQGSASLCRGSATLRFLEIVSKVRTKGRNFLKFVLDTFWHLQAFFLEKPSSSSRWQSCAAEAQFGPAAKEGRAARTKRLVSKVMRLETDLHSFRSMVQKCGESLPDEKVSRNSLFCGSFDVPLFRDRRHLYQPPVKDAHLAAVHRDHDNGERGANSRGPDLFHASVYFFFFFAPSPLDPELHARPGVGGGQRGGCQCQGQPALRHPQRHRRLPPWRRRAAGAGLRRSQGTYAPSTL